jgi:hypothetical protein
VTRRTTSPRRAIAVLVAVATLVSGACSKRDDDAKRVVGFIDATSVEAHRFSYEVDSFGSSEISVQGIVQDDFARKLQLSFDGRPAIEQVIQDDGVAIRFLQPDIVDAYVDREVTDVDVSTDVEGATVLDALKAQRWVLDPTGAPSAVVELRDELGSTGQAQAKDPLFDARTALAYVRRVAQRTPFVRYDPESISPTYRADEDPFPKPEKGSGVTRYDAVLGDLPSPSQATSGTTPDFPAAEDFRKMAVYVKAGKVIAVREFVGTSPRQRKDFERYLTALLEATAPKDVVKAFKGQLDARRSKPAELDAFMLQGLNSFIGAAGREPIRFRTMSMTVQPAGATVEEVALPTEVITGNLAVIRNIGRKPIAQKEAAKRPAVPQESATTADASETVPGETSEPTTEADAG